MVPPGDPLRHLVVEIADDRVPHLGWQRRAQQSPGGSMEVADHGVGLRSPCHMRVSWRFASSSAAMPAGVIA